jgi:membrane-associated phospholipid phosphatase
VPQELAIPLWPSAVLVYDSLYVLLLLAPFVVRTAEAFRHLAVAAALAIVIAGIVFLLLPAELGFARPAVTGPFAKMFAITDRVNLDYNLVPSLHVALAVLCVQAFWRVSSLLVRVVLALWALALAASTLLTHQHHVLDVVTGAALAVILFRVVPRTSDAG